MSALKYSHSFDPSPYYKRLYRLAHRAQVSIAAFDVVQVSGFSCEATLMRDNILTGCHVVFQMCSQGKKQVNEGGDSNRKK